MKFNILKSNTNLSSVNGYIIREFTRNQIDEYKLFKIDLNQKGISVVQIRNDIVFIILDDDLDESDLNDEIEHLLYQGSIKIRNLEKINYNFESYDIHHVLPIIFKDALIFNFLKKFNAEYMRGTIQFNPERNKKFKFQFQFLFDNIFNAYIVVDYYLDPNQEIITARERFNEITTILDYIKDIEFHLGSKVIIFSEDLNNNS